MDSNEISMDNLPHFISAYGKVAHKIDDGEKVQEILETYALKNFDQLTATQSVNMVILGGSYIQNPELIEICEKLLVSNIDMLQAEEGGASLLLEALEGFQ